MMARNAICEKDVVAIDIKCNVTLFRDFLTIRLLKRKVKNVLSVISHRYFALYEAVISGNIKKPLIYTYVVYN